MRFRWNLNPEGRAEGIGKKNNVHLQTHRIRTDTWREHHGSAYRSGEYPDLSDLNLSAEALGLHPQWEYARNGNPTRAALERLIAELEEGTQGFAFASGIAAVTCVLSLLRAGE